MRIVLVGWIILLFQIQNGIGQTLHFEWVKTAGNTASDGGQTLVTDKLGDVVCSGFFEKTIRFKSNSKTITLNSIGGNGYYDMFILKTNTNGECKWAKNIGGINAAISSYKMVVDTANNIYISGIFLGKVDFDPGSGVFELSTSGINTDVFILKLDSIGNFIWAKSFGGSAYDYCKSMSIDPNNQYIYLAGNFGGSVDFNPDNGNTDLKQAYGLNDAFISKFDIGGNYIWTQTFGSKNSDFISDIAVDIHNDVLVTASFSDTAYFQNKQIKMYKADLGTSGIICKFNSNGQYQWAQFIGDAAAHGVSISSDRAGHIYIGGYFYNFVNFNTKGNAEIKSSRGNADVFILKLTTQGNFIWVKTFEGNLDENIREMFVSPNGNIYSCTYFQNIYSSTTVYNKVDFDPSSSDYYLTNKGPSCAVISKLDSAGQFEWAKLLGGDYSVVDPADITQDFNGNIFTCGVYQSIVDFDPDLPQVNDTTTGSYDIFIHKLGYCENTLKILNREICHQQTFKFNGKLLTQSGVYLDTFKSRYGCDSVIQLNLTVLNATNSIRRIKDTLFSMANAEHYQWYNCDSNRLIAGSTTNRFRPPSKGRYGIIIQNKGCIDTSNCYSFSTINNQPFIAFPNPTNQYLTVRLSEKAGQIKYKVYNAIAQLLIENTVYNADTFILNCEVYCKGVYIVEIEIDNTTYAYKFLKI